jgi:hypothetical protein
MPLLDTILIQIDSPSISTSHWYFHNIQLNITHQSPLPSTLPLSQSCANQNFISIYFFRQSLAIQNLCDIIILTSTCTNEEFGLLLMQHSNFFNIKFNIILQSPPSGFVPSDLPLTLRVLMQYSSVPCVTYFSPISLTLTWSPERHLMKSKYEIPHLCSFLYPPVSPFLVFAYCCYRNSSRLGHRLPWLGIFVVFLSPSKKRDGTLISLRSFPSKPLLISHLSNILPSDTV